MRLATCVAIEFAVGTGLAIALGASGVWGVEQLRQQLSRDALAATLVPVQRPLDENGRPIPISVIAPLENPGSIDPGVVAFSMFHGVGDELLLSPLRDSEIERVKFNRGGSSISLRLEFEGGARAAFKPVQTNLQTVPRREIAAYRLNRLLGLNSVAPAIGREFPLSEILAKLDPDSRGYAPRLRVEIIANRRGNVEGELSSWIPVIETATIDGWRVDGLNGIVTWKRYLSVGREIPERDEEMAAQISNMVLFDMLINNSDRWTGGNVKASESGDFLYFMDNTLSFGLSDDGHERTRIYLMRSQKFSRSLVAKIRSLTADEIRSVMTGELGPFDRLLSDAEIESILSRRDVALAYVDDLIATHGEDAVLVFP